MSRSRSFRMRSALAGLVVLVAAAALAGCGSSDKSSSGGSSSGGGYGSAPKTNSTAAPVSSASGQTVKLAADEEGKLYFKTRKLSAKSGKVTLAMSNPKSSGKAHGIAVEGNGVDKDGKIVQAGSTSTVQVTLKPGRYTFYCPVPAHHKAGMQGTLVVQ